MRFSGIVYRCHNPEWAWTPLSGEGARLHGGRFNRRGVATFYGSLAPLTAIRETQPLGGALQPLTLCSYEVDAEPVFNTTDPLNLTAAGVSQAELACPAWEAEMLAGLVPASQRLGERLLEAGYVGMLVRSFAAGAGAGDLNLVLWRWGDAYPARLTLVDDEARLARR